MLSVFGGMSLRRKKRKSFAGPLALIVCFIGVWACLPMFRTGSLSLSPVLENFTKKAALVSALFTMPDKSMELLEERFNSEIFSPEEISPDPEPASSQGESQTPSSSSETSQANTVPTEQPEIPEEYRGPVIEENMAGGNSSLYVKKGSGIIKNSTKLANTDVASILEKNCSIAFKDNKEPQVLIFHTHATESFEDYDSPIYDKRHNWRSTDNSKNMVAVGDMLTKTLEENGVKVIHDTTQHDYPSYNGAYNRSAETVKKYLKQYPSIKIVLDIHRDAIQRDDTLVKPVVTINGKKAAQLMIISGCDDGTMNMPNWSENLRFAAAYQSKIEENYKGLTRPVFFCYRKYNMDLSTGALLIEVGSHGNTLEETLNTAQMMGDSLAKLINEDLTKK